MINSAMCTVARSGLFLLSLFRAKMVFTESVYDL